MRAAAPAAPSDPPALLGPAQAALVTGQVSIIVASCGPGTADAGAPRPHVMRAIGCRLSADRRQITVLMPERTGATVLADLRANGRIAVVFSRPSSNLTLQLKGVDARITAPGPDDAELAQRYRSAFADEIGGLGFAPLVADTLLAADEAFCAVHFGIAEAYEQTPGPAAGERLPPAAG